MKRTNNGLVVGGIAGVGLLAAYALLRARRHYSFVGKVVLIAGGSRGLGLVLARNFAARGASIAICARDADELDRARTDLEQRGAEVFAGVCDIRQQADVEAFVREVRDRMGEVDVLVNCAGVIQVGPLETQTQQDFENLMDVHFWGPYYAMQAVIPAMRERGSGRIVNISSIGGKIAVPHLASYCASKFALAGMSSAFGVELARDGISVTTVYPGLMRTGSHIHARFKGQNEKEFALFSLADATPLTTINAERAADQIVEACGRGDAELIITVQAKLAAKMQALAPELMSGLLSLTNRLLPADGGIGKASLSGLESTSAVSPSVATALIDNAALANNERIDQAGEDNISQTAA